MNILYHTGIEDTIFANVWLLFLIRRNLFATKIATSYL